MIQRLKTLLHRCHARAHLHQIHALLTVTGLSASELFSWMLLSAAAASDIGYAHRLFFQLPKPTLFHYNALIRAHAGTRNPIKSIHVFMRMLRNGVVPDYMTYPFLLKAAGRATDLDLGACVHGRVVRTGLAWDVFVANSLIHMYGGACGVVGYARKVFDEMPRRNLVTWNSMLDGYGKCGEAAAMREVFDRMPARDVVSWSALVDGYVKDGDYAEALAAFGRMAEEGPRPNEVTMVSVLSACAHLGALDRGKAMHQYVVDNGLPFTCTLRTSIVDMYAKCGAIEEAMAVFREGLGLQTDIFLWNAVIGGLAAHGFTAEALRVYAEMKDQSGIRPDEITYLCLLSACAHAGLVGEAWEYFNAIAEDGMVPKIEHYACMVDVLARAGHVDEAYEFISRMPVEPSASMLGALLHGCINHRKLDLAESVGKRLIKLDPANDGRYVGLSNAYAVTKRWDKARRTRQAMELRGLRKIPGYSYVEVYGSLHRFIAQDNAHPESEDIYSMLSVIGEQMKLRADTYIEEMVGFPAQGDHLRLSINF